MRRVRSQFLGPDFRLALRALAALAAVCCASLVLVSAASAAKTRVQTGSFGADGTPATTFAGGLVYQLDFSQANDKLFAVVKGPTNAVAASIHSFNTPSQAPSGGPYPLAVVAPGADPDVAVDNTSSSTANNIYYSTENTNAVTNDVYGFTAAGVALGGGFPFAAPAPSDICGIGVDTASNIWIGNFSPGSANINRGMHKYSPAGVFQSKVSTSAQGGPCHVAFDSNDDMYVSIFNGAVWKYTAASSYATATQIDAAATRTIRINRTSHELYVVHPTKVSVYDSAGALQYEFASSIVGASFRGIAIDEGTGAVYVSDSGTNATTAPGNNKIHAFGPEVTLPDATTNAPVDVTGSNATLVGSANARGFAITGCSFEYGPTTSYGQSTSCEQSVPADSSPHQVTADIAGLVPNGTIYHYRLVLTHAAGQSVGGDRAFQTAQTVVTEAATGVTDTIATLHGSLSPEGVQFTSCRFEYLTDANYKANLSSYSGPVTPQSVPCAPTAASIDPDFQSHPVSAALTGLAKNTTYHFRLIATNANGTSVGTDTTFSTQGPPQISDELPLSVDKTTATLRAKIDPQGLGTSYHFEWGTTPSYGHDVPTDFEPFLGSGSDPVTVTAKLTDLEPGTVYHYRVVATNSSGQTAGPDYAIQTLNSCDLANRRCPELVSPADKGSTGGVDIVYPAQGAFQASETGDGMAYQILNGDGTSTSGGDVIYAGTRSLGGWSGVQVTPRSLVPMPNSSGLITVYSGNPGKVKYFSPDLRCAIVETINPLTADTPATSVEFGVTNLYRWNADDGSYTLLTNRVPLNPSTSGALGVVGYEVAGASSDCSRVIFASSDYDFLPGAHRLYEWENGVLRDAGVLPDGTSVPVKVTTTQGAAKNNVSPDGSLFFTATSSEGLDAGKAAVFMRKGPGEIVDMSQPTTAVPAMGASYETASPDGSRVFFLANYGIASNSSSGPTNGNCTSLVGLHSTACDLYSYDVETGDLTDVSAFNTAPNPQGAVVQGVMAVSNDGSTVYFAARGQLVPDKGRTYAQNLQGAGFVNVYRYRDSELTFVGSLAARDVDASQSAHAVIHSPGSWTSQTSSGGRYLYFASRDNMTGTNPGGVEEAYFFSEETGTVCVSCPRDGSPPHSRIDATQGYAIASSYSVGAGRHTPRSLSEDGRVIFASEDALAPGAIEGDGTIVGSEAVKGPAQTNVYEWYRGQVSLLATGRVQFLDMGPDGRDVFLKTYSRLDSRDVDAVGDVYDLRANGGFAPPIQPPAPCDPGAGQCQRQSGQAPGVFGSPGSLALLGSGNALPVSRDELAKLKVAMPATARSSSTRLATRVPGRGVLYMSGRGIVRSSRIVAKAGTQRIAARLSSSARRRLERDRRVRIFVTVRFVPATGARAQSVRVPVTFKLAKRAANNDRRGAK
jgi:hypothetical protein